MKIDSTVIERCSFSNLIVYLKENPSLIYTQLTPILQKIKSVQGICSNEDMDCNIKDIRESEFQEFFLSLFLNYDSYDDTIASMFQSLIDVLSRNTEKLHQMSNEIIVTAYLFSYIDKLHQNGWDTLENTKLFYQMILDLYIPMENPSDFCETFINHISLIDINQHKNDIEWAKSQLQDLLEPIQNYLLLFKYVSDIYTTMERRYETMRDYHKLVHSSRVLAFPLYRLSDIFSKYFKDNTEYVISSILSILHSDNQDEEMMNFISDWSDPSVPKEAFKYLIDSVIVNSKTPLRYEPDHMIKWLALWGSTMGMFFNNTSEELTSEDKPISYLESLNRQIETDIATEAIHKDSGRMNKAEKNIYKAYRTYKQAEEKVNSQITKAADGMKKAIMGDARTEIIEGKKFSVIGLLKKLLGTVALFSFGKIKGVIFLVTKFALKKKTTNAERRKIIGELEGELEIIKEKINDAKGDGNREAKYAMMRTKQELEAALSKIKYGLEADENVLKRAKNIINRRGDEK